MLFFIIIDFTQLLFTWYISLKALHGFLDVPLIVCATYETFCTNGKNRRFFFPF